MRLRNFLMILLLFFPYYITSEWWVYTWWNEYIYLFHVRSYMINMCMFYNKLINLTTIVMDDTINKNLKLFNNEKYLTFVMQDYFQNLWVCVKTKPKLVSWYKNIFGQSLFQKNLTGNYMNSKLYKMISAHLASTKVHTLLWLIIGGWN